VSKCILLEGFHFPAGYLTPRSLPGAPSGYEGRTCRDVAFLYYLGGIKSWEQVTGLCREAKRTLSDSGTYFLNISTVFWRLPVGYFEGPVFKMSLASEVAYCHPSFISRGCVPGNRDLNRKLFSHKN
jgi:hypothetical protein